MFRRREHFRKEVQMETLKVVSKAFLNGNAATMTSRTTGTSWSNQGGTSAALIARVSQELSSSFERAPEELETALAEQGLSWGPPFPPGRPLDPFWGYRRPARTWDYTVGENVQITPRWGRMSFATLKALIDAYDVAQICIRHLVNDVRSLSYRFEPIPGVYEDVSDDLRKAREFFGSPDKRQPFRAWIAEYLQDVLRYDAGSLYIRRNEGGDPVALEVVSGTTIIPLVDFYGRLATDEDDDAPNLTARGTWHGVTTPAFVQIIMGLPWDWMAADDMIYQPWNPLPDSQYGLAPMEAVITTANTDLRFQWHFLQYFTEGTLPAGFMEAPPDMSDPAQLAEWQATWDSIMMGDQAMLRQIRWVPNGSNFTETKSYSQSFDELFPLYLMRRVAAAFGVTPNDLGFTESVNRATGDTQIDVQFRVGTLPLVRHLEDVINLFIEEFLHLRCRLMFDTGQEVADRLATARAWDIYIKNGTASGDEARYTLGLPVNRQRPMPRFIDNSRSGPIPLLALESLAGKTDPETYSPHKMVPLIDHQFAPLPGVAPIIGTESHQQAMNITAQMQDDLIRMEVKHTPATQDHRDGDTPYTSVPTADSVQASKAKDNTGGPGIHPLELPAKQDVTTEATDMEEEMTKELLQWRSNTINRIRRGQPPKLFQANYLPQETVDQVWSQLQGISDEGMAKAIFTCTPPEIPTPPNNHSSEGTPDPLDGLSEQALAMLQPSIDRLVASAERVDRARLALSRP